MKRKRLLPKQHTGKLVHHHHTAYGLLVLILFLTIIPLFTISNSVVALSADPVTKSGGVYAVVPAAIPDKAPVIRSIHDSQVFTTAGIVPINGTCPTDNIIKVYKNQVMTGSQFCQNGSFALDIDLFVGSNSITAQAYNINNASGPMSEPINVKLTLGASTSADTANLQNGPDNQLIVTSDKYFQGARIKEPLKWPFSISGGQTPYAVSVGWGDGKTDLVSRAQAGTFDLSHTYDQPGKGYHNSYDVTIQAIDQHGTTSFMHVVSIVGSDQPSVVASVKAGYNWSRALRVAWQLVVLAGVIIMGFWFGEQYEIRILKKKYNIA